MSSSSIQLPVFQAKVSNIQNAADSSAVYSNGVWSFKNSTALTSVTITDSGNVGIGTASPAYRLDVTGGHARIRGAQALFWSNSDNTNFSGIYNGGATGAANGTMVLETNGAERMRIDASGNVGVGGTPSAWGSIKAIQMGNNGAFICGGTAFKDVYVGSNGYFDGTNWRYVTSSDAGYYSVTGSSHYWYGAVSGAAGAPITFTERLRINNAGEKVFGNGLIVVLSTAIGPGAGTYAVKWNAGSGVLTYDTSSRLVKDQIENLPYGLASVLSLQPRKYFRTDDQKEEIGFIADEVQSIIPEVVPMVQKSLFTKDEQDTELIPGGVNYDKLTAVLVKAIQEQQAQIEALKAEVAALKAP